VGAWPVLEDAEIEPVWAGLDACLSGLPSEDLRWIDLLRAVGRRDARGMSSAGSALLASGRLTGVPLRYAVAATLLGLVSEGERSAARDVWRRHGRSLAGTPDLALEILAAGAAPP